MEKQKSKQSPFKENFDGVLTHDGIIKVAKTEITAKILHIEKDTVLVRGYKPKSYICNIHKDLLPLLCYAEKGDIAFVKWKNGQPWIVGYKKVNRNKSKSSKSKQETGNKQMDWISFFDSMEMEI